MKCHVLMAMLVAVLFTPASPAHAGSAASAAKKGASVGYARIATDDTVLAFGGKGTTGVVSTAVVPGEHQVTFTGKYPADITIDKVILNSTSEATNYGVTNARVTAASATEIQVDLFDWRSDAISIPGGASDFI